MSKISIDEQLEQLEKELEAKRAELERRRELAEKRKELEDLNKQLSGLEPKKTPAATGFDPAEDIPVDFVAPFQAKRYSVTDFPTNADQVKALARKHYLQQIPEEKRDSPMVKYRANVYAQAAADAVANRGGYGRENERDVYGHMPDDAYRFQDAAKRMKDSAGVDKVMPLFTEVAVPDRLKAEA